MKDWIEDWSELELAIKFLLMIFPISVLLTLTYFTHDNRTSHSF